jgi:hypothetical protein
VCDDVEWCCNDDWFYDDDGEPDFDEEPDHDPEPDFEQMAIDHAIAEAEVAEIERQVEQGRELPLWDAEIDRLIEGAERGLEP